MRTILKECAKSLSQGRKDNTMKQNAKLNIFNVPHRCVIQTGGNSIPSKAISNEEITQYMFYVPVGEGTGKFQVASATWNRGQYATPYITLYNLDTVSRSYTKVMGTVSDNVRKNVVFLCGEYDKWLEGQIETISPFESFGEINLTNTSGVSGDTASPETTEDDPPFEDDLPFMAEG